MQITKQTQDLAELIVQFFEQNRLPAELSGQGSGDTKFLIGIEPTNKICIHIPNSVRIADFTEKGINYAVQMFNLIDTIIDEKNLKILDAIVINIYETHGGYLDGRTIYPA
ncbi:MAG TPA: hypothetical protein VKB19_15945 [Pedobacter sp.]|nr:hypothetical protein [Pedobacter sp.]